MEKQESEKIRKKFYTLITITVCSEEFLKKFLAPGILRAADIRAILLQPEDSLVQLGHGHGQDHASLEFYKRILSSPVQNTFNILLVALRETGQLQAYEILNKKVPFPLSLLREGRRFQAPPSALAELFSAGKQKVVLLESSNIQMLLERIMETISPVNVINSDDAVTSGALNVILFKTEEVSLMEIAMKLFRRPGLFVVLCEEGSIPPTFLSHLQRDGEGVFVLSNKDTFKWRELTESRKEIIMNRMRIDTGLDIATPLDFLDDEELIQLVKDADAGARENRRNILMQVVSNNVERKMGAFPPELMHYLGCLAKKQLFGWSAMAFPNLTDESVLNSLCSKGLMTLTLDEIRGGLIYQFVDDYVATYFLASALTQMGSYRGTQAVDDELQRNVFSLLVIKIKSCCDCCCSKKTYEFENKMLIYFLDAFFPSKDSRIRYVPTCTKANIKACLNGSFLNICKDTCRNALRQMDSNGRFLIYKPDCILSWDWSTLSLLRGFGVTLDEKDAHGRNLLHYAIEVGRGMTYIKMLNQCGASYTDKDYSGNTVLHTAAISGHVRAVRHFSKYLNVNEKNEMGDTTLHKVLEYGTKNKNAIVKLLLENGADVNAKNNKLRTPLYVAKYGRNKEKIKPKTIKFLEKKGGKEKVLDEK